jgi:hypothetical protein
MGSIAIGDKEITSVFDLETECSHKPFVHAAGIFVDNEEVQIFFKSNGGLAEIRKADLNEVV